MVDAVVIFVVAEAGRELQAVLLVEGPVHRPDRALPVVGLGLKHRAEIAADEHQLFGRVGGQGAALLVDQQLDLLDVDGAVNVAGDEDPAVGAAHDCACQADSTAA